MKISKFEVMILVMSMATLTSCSGFVHATRSVAHTVSSLAGQIGTNTGKLKTTTETRTLKLADWRTLKVNNEIGEIRVMVSPGKPSVTITKRFYKPENLTFLLENRSQSLMIEGQVKNKKCYKCGIDLTFKIPENLAVEIQNNIGNVFVTGQTKFLNASANIGDLIVQNLGTSDANLHSNTGDIDLQNAQGKIDLQTNIGDITVNDLTGSLNLHTNTGDVSAKNIQLEPNSDNNLTSNMGTVHLERFNAIDGIKIEGSTNMGDLELQLTGFQVTEEAEVVQHQFTAFKVGARPAKVNLETNMGTIHAQVAE